MTATPPPQPAPERPGPLALLLNYLPLLLLAAGLGLALLCAQHVGTRVAAFAAWLYLAPPLLGRVVQALLGRPQGHFGLHTRCWRAWWWLTQLQMPFNRLPLLEELLRLVPGLYAGWVALWGGRISPLAFIGPRVCITDRYAVQVHAGAVLGLGSTLAGHMVTRDAQGRYRITVAAPVVQAHAIVGGYAGLGPGATLHTGALLPSGRRLGPFDHWPRSAAPPAAAPALDAQS